MHDQVASLLREATIRRSAAKSKVEEIVAIIDANFAPSQCNPRALAAWLYSYTILALAYGFWMQLTHFHKEFDVERVRNMALEVIEARVQRSWRKSVVSFQ